MQTNYKQPEKCVWCNKTFEEHSNDVPENKPRVPCLLCKDGFVSQQIPNTSSKENNYKKLKSIIISSVKEATGEDIMELKMICPDCGSELGVDEDGTIFCGEICKGILQSDKTDRVKLGRDITLEDVLIAIGIQEYCNYSVDKFGEFGEFIEINNAADEEYVWQKTGIFWQLGHSLEWHRDNKPEVIDFLLEILDK